MRAAKASLIQGGQKAGKGVLNITCRCSNKKRLQRRAKDGSRQSVKCPTSVKLYNQFMGGVDISDARRKSYSCSRQSKRWWMHLFYSLVDISVVNSSIITHESLFCPKMTKEFIWSTAEELMAITSIICHHS